MPSRTHIDFAKMHVCGNDFMVLDAVTVNRKYEHQQVLAWADRHKGIGFDQLLVLEPPMHPDQDFFLRIHNTDGSEAKQCGNGCAAVVSFARMQGLVFRNGVNLGTLGGSVKCEVSEKATAYEAIVKVELTEPDSRPQSLPFVTDSTNCNQTMELASARDREVSFTTISIGNPHAVIFVDDVEVAPVAEIGVAFQADDKFPESVNVEFVQVLDRSNAKLRVYERGVGETLACGSGACAAMAAGRINNVFSDAVLLSMPGGTTQVSWNGTGHRPVLHAKAQLVYTGRSRI